MATAGRPVQGGDLEEETRMWSEPHEPLRGEHARQAEGISVGAWSELEGLRNCQW